MPRYKVGDDVLVKVKIGWIDPDDQFPYRASNTFWFAESDVFALVTESIPAQPEPLKVAEFVRTAMGEIGQIISVDSEYSVVRILFPLTVASWIRMSDLTRTERPADWPF